MNVRFPQGNILSFLSEWNEARHSTKTNLPILNLQVSYKYDSDNDIDYILVKNSKPINFSNASSGLQALIPLYVYINYLTSIKSKTIPNQSVEVQNKDKRLLLELVCSLIKKHNILPMDTSTAESNLLDNNVAIRFKINDEVFPFPKEVMNEYQHILNNFQRTDHYEFFIEEPEENLFPHTQTELMRWLNEINIRSKRNIQFFATHSPFIIKFFLDNCGSDDVNIMKLEQLENGQCQVVALNAQEKDNLKEVGAACYFDLDWCCR